MPVFPVVGDSRTHGLCETAESQLSLGLSCRSPMSDNGIRVIPHGPVWTMVAHAQRLTVCRAPVLTSPDCPARTSGPVVCDACEGTVRRFGIR